MPHRFVVSKGTDEKQQADACNTAAAAYGRDADGNYRLRKRAAAKHRLCSGLWPDEDNARILQGSVQTAGISERTMGEPENSLCFDAAGGGAGHAAVRGAGEAQGGGRHAIHGTLPHTGAPHGGCAVYHDAAGPDWYCRPCGIRSRADIRLYQVSADPVHTRLRRRDSRISLEGDTLRGVLYAGADGVGFQYIG